MSNVHLKANVESSIEPILLKKVKNLDTDTASTFEKRFLDRKKNGVIAFVLSIFGLHRFYYGGQGLIAVLQFLLCMSGIGYLWVVVDWFTMSKTIHNLNADIGIDVYRQVTA